MRTATKSKITGVQNNIGGTIDRPGRKRPKATYAGAVKTEQNTFGLPAAWAKESVKP